MLIRFNLSMHNVNLLGTLSEVDFANQTFMLQKSIIGTTDLIGTV